MGMTSRQEYAALKGPTQGDLVANCCVGTGQEAPGIPTTEVREWGAVHPEDAK